MIAGTGFGTHPTVFISGQGIPGVTLGCNGAPSFTCDTQITVTSNGYDGNNFVPGQPGQSAHSQRQVNIEPFPAPVPVITFLGQNVAGTTQWVVVGQQIALAASVSLPRNGSVFVQSR